MKKILIVLIVGLPLCAGCAHGNNVLTVQRQSNLATFLFGGKEPSQPPQKVPLTLPARVGVTFVPGDPASANIPETTKKEVVEAVRAQLARHSRYVAGAQAIPSMYLVPGGGVSNLDQVAGQFGVDVIVLLGANQFQKHERNPLAAFMDITIIGAFLIPGTRVDTATVLEAAVYHVPSRALIFRTDGADEKKSWSSNFGASQTALNDAVNSIEGASKKLVVAIADALTGFEKFDASKADRIRPIVIPEGKGASRQENYWGQVSSYRSTGGGASDVVWIVLAGGALLCTAGAGKRS